MSAGLGECQGSRCSEPIENWPVIEDQNVWPKCKTTISSKTSREGSWNLLTDDTGRVTRLHGWAVDFTRLGGPRNARGWPAVVVRLLVDTKRDARLPDQLANMSRPDIVRGLVPNPEHGFEYVFPIGHFQTGKHSIQILVLGENGGVQPISQASQPKCMCNGRQCPC